MRCDNFSQEHTAANMYPVPVGDIVLLFRRNDPSKTPSFIILPMKYHLCFIPTEDNVFDVFLRVFIFCFCVAVAVHWFARYSPSLPTGHRVPYAR